MKHDRIFVRDFHGVAFSEIPELRVTKDALPDGEFYARLYRSVRPDPSFLASKRRTGELVGAILREHLPAGNMLSWGAGTGTVEAALVDQGWSVDAVEPASPEDWPATVRRYGALRETPPRSYDAVIAISTLYSQDDAECASLLRAFADRLLPGGVLIIAEQDTRGLAGTARGWVGRLLRLGRPFQFWGYLRAPEFFIRETPLRHVRSHFFALDGEGSYQPIPAPARLFGRQIFTRRSRAQLHVFRK